MKLNKILALLIALAMLTALAFAEEADGFDMLGQEVAAEAGAVDAAPEVDPEAGEAEGGLLEQEADETDGEASLLEGGGAEAPEGNGSLSEGAGSAGAETEGVGSVKYCFIVGDTLFAEQEAQDGETIVRPDDPQAPDDMAFEGWFLEDGTELFVDADDDGGIDPVIACVDPLCLEVNVYARFAEGEEDEDDSLRHGDAATPPSQREAFGDEGDAEDEPQKPSPLGEGAEQSEAEEVVSPDEMTDADETNGEATSPVSADAETEGAYRPGLAENSPQESFPGAAAPAEGEAFGDDGNDGGIDAAATEAVVDDEAAQKLSPDEGSKGNAENEPQKPSPLGEGAEQSEAEEVVSPDEMTDADETNGEPTSPVSADAETEGAYRPGLAENSPQESFPGAAAPAEGEASENPESEEIQRGASLSEGGGAAVPEGVALEKESDSAAAPEGDPTPLPLSYTGEAQALVSATGDWLFSLDGEQYGNEIPTAVNAGEYTVYFVPADDSDAAPQTLTVTIAKADVSFTPPVAATEAA